MGQRLQIRAREFTNQGRDFKSGQDYKSVESTVLKMLESKPAKNLYEIIPEFKTQYNIIFSIFSREVFHFLLLQKRH